MSDYLQEEAMNRFAQFCDEQNTLRKHVDDLRKQAGSELHACPFCGANSKLGWDCVLQKDFVECEHGHRMICEHGNVITEWNKRI